MKVTILGCGTSGGVPVIPGFWGSCDPSNPKNRRQRSSIHIEEGDTSLVIDTTPDFRNQIIANNIKHLDAVFYTHDHADHVHGIDDLRGFFHAQHRPVPIYADEHTLSLIKHRFDYVFISQSGYPAIASANEILGPVQFGNIKMIPFVQGHGAGKSLGYRFGDFAYSTDLNYLDDTAFNVLEGVKVWIVDALRYDPHPTHAHLDMTLEWIEKVQPEKAILTHLAWQMDYEELMARTPDGVEPAYDGMQIVL